MRVYFDSNNIVKFVSDRPFMSNVFNFVEMENLPHDVIGKKLTFGERQGKGIKLAVVCNFDAACGIATYAKYLIDALRPKVAELKIFSERSEKEKIDGDYDIDYCWTRGESLKELSAKIADWNPTFTNVQHEYGIFPKTPYLLQLLQTLRDRPYAVTLHSVYEHLDKTVATTSMKNIVVHTASGLSCLKKLGNTSNITVIPHGCVIKKDEEKGELYNTWHTEYPIVQFGFGFSYKGVEIALEALRLLIDQDPLKYQKVFYTYFCSESPQVKNVIDSYVKKIEQKIRDLCLEDNALLVRGFQSDQSLNNCIRTARLCIFPYLTDPKNRVHGASGASRIAMANGIPVITSSSDMFDDLAGIVPRPQDASQLAREIDLVFSDGSYRQGILENQSSYVAANSWAITADRYLDCFKAISGDREDSGTIFVG